jgi:iron(III) transport system ATP-binding protein
MALLTVENIVASINNNIIANNISFTQNALQKIAIIGETGSGKTTLLKLIAGLIQPQNGNIFLLEERVKGPNEQLLPGHPKIAYLSQHFELRNNYKVNELLAMMNKKTDEAAQKVYEACKIAPLLKRKSNELSGGERQRIVLAGLLTTNPLLLLLDEPFSNLDRAHKQNMQSIIEAIGKELNISCMMVSHDGADVVAWADRILVMQAGKIIQDNNPQQVYHYPNNEYVAGLLGAYQFVHQELKNKLKIRSNKNIFRPEEFLITNELLGIKGIIQQKKFFGNYYLLDILIDQCMITVQTNNAFLKVNDEVFIAFKHH